MTPALETTQRSRQGRKLVTQLSRWNFPKADSGKDLGSPQNFAGQTGERQLRQATQRNPFARRVGRGGMPDLHRIVGDRDGMAHFEEQRRFSVLFSVSVAVMLSLRRSEHFWQFPHPGHQACIARPLYQKDRPVSARESKLNFAFLLARRLNRMRAFSASGA